MRPEADIGLVPSNPDAVLAFYRDVMGFVEQPSATFNEVVQYRFAVGKHLLKVNRIPALPAPQRGGFELAIGMRMLRFLLDDLDAVLARLDAADHEYTSIDVPEASDFRLVRTRDPEGNVFELVGLNTPGGEALTSRVEIGFTVSDLARSRKWYGEVLGLPEQQPITIDADIGVRYGFTWGATTLQMWQMPGRLPVETGNAFERAGIRYLTVLCDDIVAAQAEIIRRGIPIVQPLNELPGAVAKVFIFKDPDGNWLEYAQKA